VSKLSDMGFLHTLDRLRGHLAASHIRDESTKGDDGEGGYCDGDSGGESSFGYALGHDAVKNGCVLGMDGLL
jgi:hypothetical protein